MSLLLGIDDCTNILKIMEALAKQGYVFDKNAGQNHGRRKR